MEHKERCEICESEYNGKQCPVCVDLQKYISIYRKTGISRQQLFADISEKYGTKANEMFIALGKLMYKNNDNNSEKH